MHRTIFLFAIATVFSTFSYGQSSDGWSIGDEDTKTQKTSSPKLPPVIGGEDRFTIVALPFPNPSRGVFQLLANVRLGSPTSAITEYSPSTRKGQQSVLVEIVKLGSGTVFTLRDTYPLDTTIDLTKFGKGTYYLTVSTDKGSSIRRLIVE